MYRHTPEPGADMGESTDGDRTGDAVTVTGSDTGCGIPAARPRQAGLHTSGGRGLVLIDKATDQADIETGRSGTTVRMTWRR